MPSKKYIPIEQVASINEVSLKSLKTLRYSTAKENDDRFKCIDGKWYALENYKYPYADELYNLLYKALIVAKSEYNLATELAKISNIKRNTILKYIKRANFKSIPKAKEIIVLLTTYIENNSLFSIGDLKYD